MANSLSLPTVRKTPLSSSPRRMETLNVKGVKIRDPVVQLTPQFSNSHPGMKDRPEPFSSLILGFEAYSEDVESKDWRGHGESQDRILNGAFTSKTEPVDMFQGVQNRGHTKSSDGGSVTDSLY